MSKVFEEFDELRVHVITLLCILIQTHTLYYTSVSLHFKANVELVTGLWARQRQIPARN